MSTPETVIETYESIADTWAIQRNRQLIERRWLDRFLAACPRNTGRPRVVDLGCGSGAPIARYLSERGARITGVDASPGMCAHFAMTVPGAEAVQADMRGLDLGQRFDGILAWNSFFHLSAGDQAAMFETFARLADYQAALMFTSGPSAGEAIGEVGGKPIYHASLSPEAYGELLDRAGFKVISFVAEDPECGGHTIWLARRRAGAEAT